MTNKKKNGFNVILIAVLAALTAVLDIFGIVAFPLIHGVSAFYIASAFYLIFVNNFGWRGAIAIYLGLIIASLFSGFSLFPLYGAWGNVVATLFIVFVMAKTGRDIELKTKKDFVVLAGCYLIAPFISAVWVIGGWVIVGIVPREAFWTILFGWWLGGVIVHFIISTPLLKFVSPLIRRFNI
jgi:hypothetical protein